MITILKLLLILAFATLYALDKNAFYSKKPPPPPPINSQNHILLKNKDINSLKKTPKNQKSSDYEEPLILTHTKERDY